MSSIPDGAVSGPRALKKAGSPDWCWQTVDLLKRYLYNIEQTWQQADEVVGELHGVQAWKVLPTPEKPYGSFDKLCKELLGMRAQDVAKRIDREKIKALGPNRGRTVTERIASSRDTRASVAESDSSDYVMSRLKRDAEKADPDPGAASLYSKVLGGEVTPNAAARQMGWRKPRIVLSTPDHVAKRLRDHFKDPGQRILLAELLTKED